MALVIYSGRTCMHACMGFYASKDTELRGYNISYELVRINANNYNYLTIFVHEREEMIHQS